MLLSAEIRNNILPKNVNLFLIYIFLFSIVLFYIAEGSHLFLWFHKKRKIIKNFH